MPLITASHFLELSAGIRPGNAVFTGDAAAPHVFASATAMSASKPTTLPLVVAYSIGGNVGSVEYLNVGGWRAAAPPAPAVGAVTRVGGGTITILRVFPPTRNP